MPGQTKAAFPSRRPQRSNPQTGNGHYRAEVGQTIWSFSPAKMRSRARCDDSRTSTSPSCMSLGDSGADHLSGMLSGSETWLIVPGLRSTDSSIIVLDRAPAPDPLDDTARRSVIGSTQEIAGMKLARTEHSCSTIDAARMGVAPNNRTSNGHVRRMRGRGGHHCLITTWEAGRY